MTRMERLEELFWSGWGGLIVGTLCVFGCVMAIVLGEPGSAPHYLVTQGEWSYTAKTYTRTDGTIVVRLFDGSKVVLNPAAGPIEIKELPRK